MTADPKDFLPPDYSIVDDPKQIERIDDEYGKSGDCKMCGRMDIDYFAGTHEHDECRVETPTDKVLKTLFRSPLKDL